MSCSLRLGQRYTLLWRKEGEALKNILKSTGGVRGASVPPDEGGGSSATSLMESK